MIQLIGIMIGMYILTRMIEISERKGNGVVLFIFCVGTFLVTVICMALLLGAPSAGIPPIH